MGRAVTALGIHCIVPPGQDQKDRKRNSLLAVLQLCCPFEIRQEAQFVLASSRAVAFAACKAVTAMYFGANFVGRSKERIGAIAQIKEHKIHISRGLQNAMGLIPANKGAGFFAAGCARNAFLPPLPFFKGVNKRRRLDYSTESTLFFSPF